MRFFPGVLAGTLLLALFAAPSFALEGSGSAPLKAGAEFPDFVLPDVNGRPVSLSDFRGKAILLSFWSCHTDTCFTSVRVIERLLKEYSPMGLVAPTICSEVPPALEKNGYAALLERCGTGQVVLIDRDMALTAKLGIKEFPTTYLIDRNRSVWGIVTGIRPIMEEEFLALVRSLVTE